MTASGSEVLRRAGVPRGRVRARRWRVMCFSQARLSTMRFCWRLSRDGTPCSARRARSAALCAGQILARARSECRPGSSSRSVPLKGNSRCEDAAVEKPACPRFERQRCRPPSDLSRRVHVSRQTIHAIERVLRSPTPGSCVNLGARECGGDGRRAVFAHSGPLKSPGSWLPRWSARNNAIERAARAHLPDWVALGRRPVCAAPYYMPEADGFIKRTRRANGRVDWLYLQRRSASETARVCWVRPATGLLSRDGTDLHGHTLEGQTGFAGTIVSCAPSSKSSHSTCAQPRKRAPPVELSPQARTLASARPAAPR